MKHTTLNEKKSRAYSLSRRRTAWALAIIYLFTQFFPSALVMAAPQMFVAPTAGVSRAPLGVMRFDAPGFGDLEDAVNLANGNVYAALDGLSRNNLTNPPSTTNPADTGDETANNIGGRWQVTPRMRLFGYSANLIQNSLPTSSYWNGYWEKPNSTQYRLAPEDGGCGSNSYSGIMRYESIPAGTYKVSFLGRTEAGTLPVWFGTDDQHLSAATLTPQWQWFSAQFTLLQADARQRLFEIIEQTTNNPAWFVGSVVVERTSDNTGNLIQTQDLTNPYFDGWCARPTVTASDSGLFMSHDKAGEPAANHSGLMRLDTIPAGTYTVSLRARSFGNNLSIAYGLSDSGSATVELTPNWRTLTTEFTIAQSDARRFQIYEWTKTNVPWEISDVDVRSKSSVQSNYTLGTGDGTNVGFSRVTPTSLSWFSDKPTWISRYKGSSDAAPTLNGVVLYELQSRPGRQHSSEWLVRVPLGSGQGFAVHRYAQDGTRSTFYSDGEYVDYVQTLSQQLRSAQAQDPEGIAATSPKTQLTYTAVNSGRISRVRDEWGRTSTYAWNSDGTLGGIYHLLRNENDNSSWTRVTDFGYETINNERVITYMAYRAYDGIGNTQQNIQGRWFDFGYRVENGRLLLDNIRRPTLSKLGMNDDGSGGRGWRTTTYTYDVNGRVTKASESGVPDILYTYGTSGEFKGPMVTVVQCNSLLTATCPSDNNRKESQFHFDMFGRLRKQRLRDYNPFVADHYGWFKHNGLAEKWLETTYSYYRNGSTALITEPSGKTTHFVYDSQQNLTRRAVYASNPFSPEFVVPVVVTLEGRFKQIKGQRAAFTARVRDAASGGVKWQVRQGATVLWDSDTAPGGNGYASAPNIAVSNEGDSKRYDLTFDAAASTYTNANAQYTLYAISKTDQRQFSDVNYVVTPKVKDISVVNAPPRFIVVPGCVEALSATCNPSTYRTRIFVPVVQTATPGFSIDSRVKPRITAVTTPNPTAPTLTPSNFTVTGDYGGFWFTPPAWSAGFTGQNYSVTFEIESWEDSAVKTTWAQVPVGYLGLSTADMFRDTRFNPSYGPWPSYLSDSDYQQKVKLENPPSTFLTTTWVSNNDAATFRTPTSGCLQIRGFWFWEAPSVDFTVSLAQYPQVNFRYVERAYMPGFQRYFSGCKDAPNPATLNPIVNAPILGTSSSTLVPSSTGTGSPTRVTAQALGPAPTNAYNSQIVNNEAQRWNTDTTDEPEFPNSVRAGYVRDEQTTYTDFNLPLEQIQPAVSGSNFSYGEVKQVHGYTHHSASSGGQTFFAPATHRVGTRVGGAEKRHTLETYDLSGRLTKVERIAGGVTSTRSYDYGFNGTQTFSVYSPHPIGTSGAGYRSGVNEPVAFQYGDQPSASYINGEGTGFYYDMLGNVIWESCFNCYTKKVERAENGTLTATDFHRAVFRSFNGFGQQVWEAVYSWNGPGEDKWEALKMWRYYSSGELDASFEGDARNLTVYSYDTNSGNANFGRLTTVKRGVDSNTDAILNTEREVTTLAYDTFGRVSSNSINGQTTDFTYDTSDRFTRSVSSAPEQRFVYRTYSASNVPDYDCTGSTIDGALVDCKYKAVDPLGRVTNIIYATNVAQNEAGDTSWSEAITYDAFDRPLISVSNRLEMNASADDRSTKMRYDDEGRLLMMVGPKLRTKADNGYTDSRRSAIAYGYDDLGRKTKEAVALQDVYDINSAIPDSDAAITSYVYNNWDRVTSSVEPRGYTTTMLYDEVGSLIEKKQQISGTIYATTQTAYDALGRPVTRIDPRGKVSRLTYDLMGLKTRETDARGVTTKIYGYSPDGLLERVYEPRVQNGYDNNTVATGLNPNTLDGYVMTKRYNYGSSKYPISECDPYLTSDASSDVNCTIKTTDAIGRVTQDTLSDGGIITRAYDVNNKVISVTDADGFKVTYVYDAYKRLRSIKQVARTDGIGATTDADAGLSAGLTSTYAYDLMGNLTRKVERGLTTRYEYNSLSKVIAETRTHIAASVGSPLYKKYTYRLDGGRTAETNFSYAGDLSSYATRQPRIAGGSGTPSVTEGNVQVFELDAVGNVISESSKGKASDGTVLLEKVATYTYSGLNQRTSRNFNGHEAIYQAQRNPDGKFRLVGNNSNTVNPLGAMDTRVYTNWQYDMSGNLVYKVDSLASDFSNPFNIFSYSYTDTGKVGSSSRNVSVKIPAFQNDVTLGATVTLAATNGYVAGVYNSRDQAWQVNVEDNSADGVNTVGQKFNRITQYAFYVDGARSSSTVLLWDGGGVATGTKGTQTFTYDKRGREVTRTDSDGAPDTRSRSSSSAAIVGVGTGTATTPSVGDVLKTLLDQQLAGNGNVPGLQPARPVKGSATITNSYSAGLKSMKITDGNNKCLYQQDTTLTVGGQIRSSKEWEWDPKNPTSQSDYVEVVCGTGQPSRLTTVSYTADGMASQQTVAFRDVGTHNSELQINSTATQTVGMTMNNYGQVQSEAVKVDTASTGTQTSPVYRCEPGSYTAINTGDTAVTESYSTCSGSASVTVPPRSSVSVSDKATSVFDRYVWVPYGQSQTQTTNVTHNYDATGNGFAVGKSQATTIAGTQSNAYQTVSEDSDGNYSFITDSRGNRLKVFGGKYSNYIKRYDADDQPAMFFRWDGSSGQPFAAYNDFRFDPMGEEVLSSSGGLIQRSTGSELFTVKRDSNATYSIGGVTQLIRKRVGDLSTTTNSYSSSNLVRDPMYSSADGINDATQWSGVVLFDAVPGQAGSIPLEAPTTPLSATTRVDPSGVSAPNQDVPNTNPGQVTPPTGSGTQASGTAVTSDAPQFGIRLVTLASPSAPTNTSSGGFTSKPALTDSTSTQSNNASAQFQVQITNLEPPSSVLPASLSTLNALNVTAPASVLPDTPSVGLGDLSAILPPNSAVVLPNVGITPADDPGTIQAPTSVTGGLPPTITNQPIANVKPPTSVNNVKPLDGQLVWVPTNIPGLDGFLSEVNKVSGDISDRWRKAGKDIQKNLGDFQNEVVNEVMALLMQRINKEVAAGNISSIVYTDAQTIFRFVKTWQNPVEKLSFLFGLAAFSYEHWGFRPAIEQFYARMAERAKAGYSAKSSGGTALLKDRDSPSWSMEVDAVDMKRAMINEAHDIRYWGPIGEAERTSVMVHSLLGFLIIPGVIDSLVMAISGKDWITGYSLEAWERWLLAAGAVAVVVGPKFVSIVTTQTNKTRSVYVFFHGTGAYEADAIVANQGFNGFLRQARQASEAPGTQPGVFITTQESTASYYSSFYSSGKGGGPSVIKMEISEADFVKFAKKNGIAYEQPIPTAPRPGQTETIIPFYCLKEFNAIAVFSMCK